MKKLLSIGILLSLMIISCKKEITEPEVQKSVQTISNRCQDSGICSEAIYDCDSVANYPPNQYDTVIHQTGSTTILAQTKLTFIGYGTDGSSVPQDTFMYKVSMLNFNTNLIDTTNFFIRYTSKGKTLPFFSVKTKKGLWVIFRFKEYV